MMSSCRKVYPKTEILKRGIHALLVLLGLSVYYFGPPSTKVSRDSWMSSKYFIKHQIYIYITKPSDDISTF